MPKKKKTKKRFLTKSVPKSFKLPIQTVTFIPSTKDINKKISPSQFKKRVDDARKYLSKISGGYTSVRTTGGFVSKKGNLVKEKVVSVTAYFTRPSFKKNKRLWLSWVRKKRKEWGQEAIGIIIENDLYFV